jgi:flotillin
LFWFSVVVAAIVAAIVAIALLNRFYVKATRDSAVIRTGIGGGRIVIDGGIVAFPFLHRAERMNMRLLRLTMQQSGQNAFITANRLRVDIGLETHVRVRPDVDGIAIAAQTLGAKAFREDEMQSLLLPKLQDAVQAETASRTLDELHENRTAFVGAVSAALAEKFEAYGLMVAGVSLTQLDQTPFSALDDSNVFNAVGMRRLAEMISENRKARVAVEAEADISIRKRQLGQTLERLAIERQQEQAETEKRLESEQRRIRADSDIETAREASNRLVQEARIEREREIKQAEIERDIHLRRRELEALTEIEARKLDNSIQIAAKRAEEMLQQAKTEVARVKVVEAQEGVQTSRDLAGAERARRIAVLKAAQDGEVEGQKVKSQSASILMLAKAEGEAATLKGKAERERATAEAAGRRAMIDAENLQSESLLRARVEMHKLDRLPEIAAQMMKPVEKIESIRINQIAGLGSGGDAGNGGSPFDQALQSILGMSVQLPMMKKIGDEIGLDFDAQLAGRTADAAARAASAQKPRKEQ